jgi:alpha-D-ribose 1-methylphosphonate 5-triphosphate diphosphatase
MKTYLTGARVVLADQVLEDGAVLIDDGSIAAINPESSGRARAVPLDGRTLLPGLIDLHCDALEKEVEPRPNVFFPLDFAVSQADKRNAANGITTVFHAISFAHDELGVRNNHVAADVARAVHQFGAHALVDNRVHCRYEITDATGLAVLQDLLADGDVDLLSVMDHTPGQGQFKSLDAYRKFLSRTYAKSEDEADAVIQRKLDETRHAYGRLEVLVGEALDHGVPVASHDDDSPERVSTMAGLGARLSEFPVNVDTARAARAAELHTIVGAPNILRGRSQSGSMRALDAIEEGVADCLCADYSPPALLGAVFHLADRGFLDLASAVRLVSRNPARAVGLGDRGVIAPGRRADLIAVERVGDTVHPTHVWVHGRLVHHAGYGMAGRPAGARLTRGSKTAPAQVPPGA